MRRRPQWAIVCKYEHSWRIYSQTVTLERARLHLVKVLAGVAEEGPNTSDAIRAALDLAPDTPLVGPSGRVWRIVDMDTMSGGLAP